jgi:pyruvate carboxylase
MSNEEKIERLIVRLESNQKAIQYATDMIEEWNPESYEELDYYVELIGELAENEELLIALKK